MHHIDLTILLTMLEHEERTTFRSLQKASRISPRSLRRHLNQMISDKTVLEEGRKQRKRGQKLLYSLTNKGRIECIHLVANNVDESIKTLQKIGTALLSDPYKFRKWQKMSVDKIFDEIPGAIHTEEQRQGVSEEIAKIYEPLVNAYGVMHKLVSQVWAAERVEGQDVFIGFSKDGNLCLIPAKALERKGLDSYLLSPPHRSAQQQSKGH